jgi:hypothetical protein
MAAPITTSTTFHQKSPNSVMDFLLFEYELT